NGSGGLYGTYFSYSPFTTIVDPVVGYRYQLDSELKTARQAQLRSDTERKLSVTTPNMKEKAADMEKLTGEFKAAAAAMAREHAASAEKLQGELRVLSRASGAQPALAGSPAAPGLFGGVLTTSLVGQPKYESRTENLGMQNIEGVEAEGTRKITVIPAGAIGNERQIEIVYETWFSKDLQLIVKSNHSDPRFGEQTYRLTNIVRTEPDPSHFSLPTGYRVITESPSVYTIKSKTEGDLGKAVTAPKIVRVTTKPAPAVVIEKPNP
ncbi:MAG: hypothetical protein ABIV48_04330, partial [Pyrinomonadaceae bacterium]